MPTLLLIEGNALAAASAGTSILVAALALILAGIAFGAMRRRRNPALKWVAIAFLLFSLKNAFSALNVLTHLVKHDAIELVLSLFDLLLLVLLLLPFLRRRRA